MSLTTILLGLSLISPVMSAPADTARTPKPKPEIPAPAPAPPPRTVPKVEPRRDLPAKPLVPVGEPKLKRRKLPD
jgi:hypothetical protein